jgi:RNA polymerase sigma-70 factor (ECF subfamily)
MTIPAWIGTGERVVYWPLAHPSGAAGRRPPGIMTFDDAYRRHLPAVLRAACRVVGRKDVAEEITADAFLELHRQFDRIDADRLPGWLLTVVRNRAIDYWRRQRLERRHLEDEAGRGVPTEPPTSLDGLFVDPSLKPVHRACLTLRYVHGFSRDEIARRLGLTETQVRGHLQYGLTLLRKRLIPER